MASPKSTPAKKRPPAAKKPAKPRARKPKAEPAENVEPVVSGGHPRIHPSVIAAERARATPNFAPVPAAKRRRR